MDEVTKQAFGEFVRKVLAAAEQGATWSAAQAPLVVQEWLRWQLISSALYALGFVLLAAALVVATIKMIRLGKEYDYCMPGPILSGVCAVFMLGVAS